MRVLDNFGQEVVETGTNIHTQLLASRSWRVAHNKGRNIVAQVFNSNWERIICEEDQTDPNVAVYNHEAMFTGYVVYV